MSDLDHPKGEGNWTLLQQHPGRAMWQQDLTSSTGAVVSRFWIINPPEDLMYDTFDEAEAMFEVLESDD